MNPHCHQFRDTALERLGQPQPTEASHAARCEACATWLGRVQGHVRAFGELARHEAPAELFAQVAEGLRFDSDQRIERITATLASLEGPGAPAELDERVLADLASEAADAPAPVQALRTLTCHPAPAVLDRLVAEELEKPEYHRVNRFTDLEKMRAPDALGEELEKSLQPSLFTRRAGSLIGSLAAAGLVLWMAVGFLQGPSGSEGPRFDSRPFEVVSAESTDDFHPWLKSGIGILAGPRPVAQADSSTSNAKEPNTKEEMR